MDSIGYNRSDPNKVQPGSFRLVSNEIATKLLTLLTLDFLKWLQATCLSPSRGSSSLIQFLQPTELLFGASENMEYPAWYSELPNFYEDEIAMLTAPH